MPRPRERPRAGLRTPSGRPAWRAANGSVGPPSEKGKGPVSVLYRENRARARYRRDRHLSLRGASCRPLFPRRLTPRPAVEIGRSCPRAEPRVGQAPPVSWVEVDDGNGYDVDLDTPDQYAA